MMWHTSFSAECRSVLELRVEADFYGLDDLGKLVDEAKAEGK